MRPRESPDFYRIAGGIGGQSEHRRVLGDGGHGSGGDGLALFSSTEHEGLVNSAISVRYHKLFCK